MNPRRFYSERLANKCKVIRKNGKIYIIPNCGARICEVTHDTGR